MLPVCERICYIALMIAAATPITSKPVKFTPAQYFYLSDQNLFGGRRTELIHGEIIYMCAQYDLHAFGVSRAFSWLNRAFPENRFWVRPQMTLHCGENVPEPDLAVIPDPPKPTKTVMKGDRAVLIIEVSDTTLEMDTLTKPEIYAGAKVPDYWVLDVNLRRLIVHREPTGSVGARMGPRYKSIVTYDDSARVAPLAAPKKFIRVSKMLP